jgi:hypothetical protein
MVALRDFANAPKKRRSNTSVLSADASALCMAENQTLVQYALTAATNRFGTLHAGGRMKLAVDWTFQQSRFDSQSIHEIILFSGVHVASCLNGNEIFPRRGHKFDHSLHLLMNVKND